MSKAYVLQDMTLSSGVSTLSALGSGMSVVLVCVLPNILHILQVLPDRCVWIHFQLSCRLGKV